MDAVHWWALCGLVWLAAGFWALARAHDKAAQAAADVLLLRRQLEMMREAIALTQYGARSEAHALIDEAAALRPLWVLTK